MRKLEASSLPRLERLTGDRRRQRLLRLAFDFEPVDGSAAHFLHSKNKSADGDALTDGGMMIQRRR